MGGHQVVWKPSTSWTVKSSSFLGREVTTEANALRLFHNFYAIWKGKSRWGMILGLETGWQNESKSKSPISFWMSPVATFRYQMASHWILAARLEQYLDRSQVIISLNTNCRVGISGISIYLDRRIFDRILWRVEGKLRYNADPILQASQRNPQKTSIMGLCYPFGFEPLASIQAKKWHKFYIFKLVN